MSSFVVLRTVLKQQLPLQFSKSSSSLALSTTAPAHRCLCSTPAYRTRNSKPVGVKQRDNSNLVPNCNNLVLRRNYGSIYEPEYLDTSGPEIPLYDLLNIQIKGYDFPVLEKYSKYVHNIAEKIGLTVEEAWATPGKRLRVTKLKPESTVLETEYSINLYERNVQNLAWLQGAWRSPEYPKNVTLSEIEYEKIADVPATLLPVFLNVVEACIPPGVSLRIHPHLPEHTELRYVPDLQLKELRTQLEGMRGGGGGNK